MESMIVNSVDSLWVVIAGILVMFMQPGFMLVETGGMRDQVKHAFVTTSVPCSPLLRESPRVTCFKTLLSRGISRATEGPE